MKPGRIHLVVAILALVSALALSACGESESSADDNRISLTLDASPNPNHAGIYVARELGYFADAGLDLAIETPPDPAAPIERVAAGETDLAIANEPEVILAKERGLDLVTVGSVANSALTSLIWLGRSDVDEISELRGRTVAIAGIPYETAFLKTVLAYGDVDIDEVKTVEVGGDLLPPLLSGRVDATLGSYRNTEGMELRARDADPVVDPITWAGVPYYDELVLVAQPERLEQIPEAIRLFLATVVRGTQAAKKSRKISTAAVLAANPSLEPELTRAQVDDTLPLLSPTGKLNEARWDAFIAWMRENELIEEAPPASELVTNEYLPGEIAE